MLVYVQRQPHLPLEADVGFAYVNDEGKLIIHSKSIALHFHALMIEKILLTKSVSQWLMMFILLIRMVACLTKLKFPKTVTLSL